LGFVLSDLGLVLLSYLGVFWLLLLHFVGPLTGLCQKRFVLPWGHSLAAAAAAAAAADAANEPEKLVAFHFGSCSTDLGFVLLSFFLSFFFCHAEHAFV
jgi:hypothetical protein